MTQYNSDVVLFNDRRFTYDGSLKPPSGMSALRARIAFDLQANGIGDYFTLDDPTKGQLDNATYKLVDDVLVDVTDYLRHVSIRRGRSRQLDKFTAGVASLTLDNRDRAYDPTNTKSPYYGSLVPRKQVIIDYKGVNIATMMVEDWNFDFTIGGDSTAEAKCVDGFSILAQASLTAGTTTAQSTDARVTWTLNAVSWPDGQRAIGTGDASLYADVIGENVNVLSYLQLVETSEAGALFVDVDGAVAFRSRTSMQSFPTDGIVFGVNDIPFVDIANVYGTEEMTNSVQVTYPTGATTVGTATADDAAAINKYGTMEAQFSTLLADGTQADNLATFQVEKYAEPVYRVDRITVILEMLSASDVARVVGAELGDVARVNWRPNGIGEEISQYVVIDAIEHEAVPGRHQVTFTLSEAFLGFVLDDATNGVLNTSVLGF